MAAATAGTASADRAETNQFKPARKTPGAYSNTNSNGFFNFLDFSNRSNFNNYGEIPRVPREPSDYSDSYEVKIYTYAPDRYVTLAAPGLQLPPPDAADAAAAALNNPAATGSALPATERKLDDSLAQTIYDTLKSGTARTRVTKDQLDAIVGAYKDRGFAAIWTSMDGVEEKSRALIDVLNRAADEGFDPEAYKVPVVAENASLEAVESNLSTMARLDVELTALALRYAVNASGGTITPNRLSGYHDLNPPRLAAKTALARLIAHAEPGQYLLSVQPTHPAYAAMRRALADVTKTADIENRPEPLPNGPTLVPGMTDYRVGMLRARLITLGHLDAGDPQGQDAMVAPAGQELPIANSLDAAQSSEDATDNFYDRQMATAVRAFQREAGLHPDALVGPATLRAINGYSEEKFDKAARLRVNMERLRWLPRHLGTRHIFVNQASYQLQVVDNGRTVWRTKVIVGKPKNQTSFFSDVMETVVFNPYWGVPQSIIVKEMLPKLQSDPGYLDREGYEVLSSSGAKISSYDVDWWQYYDKVPLGVRQPPGRSNALGQIKFLFPNKHAIYMHDTPTKKLFARSERAFSHGCVRVENPRELAKAVLGWDQNRIASAISTGRNTKIPLQSKFNVHLTYFTAWPGANGKIAFMRDVYGRDSRIEKALEATSNALN